jgi:hypothetical protein
LLRVEGRYFCEGVARRHDVQKPIAAVSGTGADANAAGEGSLPPLKATVQVMTDSVFHSAELVSSA